MELEQSRKYKRVLTHVVDLIDRRHPAAARAKLEDNNDGDGFVGVFQEQGWPLFDDDHAQPDLLSFVQAYQHAMLFLTQGQPVFSRLLCVHIANFIKLS